MHVLRSIPCERSSDTRKGKGGAVRSVLCMHVLRYLVTDLVIPRRGKVGQLYIDIHATRKGEGRVMIIHTCI